VKSLECEACVGLVGPLNFWGNLGLAVIKLYCGIVGGSRALLADAVHSATDVLVAMLLVIGLKVQGRPADRKYPYGYGGVEFVVAGVIGLLLLLVATLMAISSILALITGSLTVPDTITLMALVISIGANELMCRHSLCVGEEANSPAIMANAWENRADAYSSVAALVGVGAAQLGLTFMDPVAAVIVAGLVAKSGASVLADAVRGATDTGLEPADTEVVRRAAASVPGVRRVLDVRGRRLGQRRSLNLQVAVAPHISVAEAERIAERVRRSLDRTLEHVGAISVRLRPAEEPETQPRAA